MNVGNKKVKILTLSILVIFFMLHITIPISFIIRI